MEGARHAMSNAGRRAPGQPRPASAAPPGRLPAALSLAGGGDPGGAGRGRRRGPGVRHRPALPDRPRLRRRPDRGAEPWAQGVADRGRGARRGHVRARLSGHVARRAGGHRSAQAGVRSGDRPVARVLRGDAHRRGALAPDQRHRGDPGGDQRQSVAGAAQHPSAGRRPGAAARHQPQADRPGADRGAAGDRTDRRDRPARAPPVARHAGSHRRARRPWRGDLERGAHRAGVRPGRARAAPLRRAGGGGLRGRGAPCARPGGARRRRDHPGVRCDRRGALGRRARRGRRPDQRRRARLVRVLCRGGGERCGRAQRDHGRPAAGGGRHRAPVRAAGRDAADRCPGGAAAPAAAAPPARSASSACALPIPRTPNGRS